MSNLRFAVTLIAALAITACAAPEPPAPFTTMHSTPQHYDSSNLSPLSISCNGLQCVSSSKISSFNPADTLLIGPPIPASEVTFRNGIALFRNDLPWDEERNRVQLRFLGRGDNTSFALTRYPEKGEEISSGIHALAAGQTLPATATPPAGTWSGSAAVLTRDGQIYTGVATFTIPAPGTENAYTDFVATGLVAADGQTQRDIAWRRLEIDDTRIRNNRYYQFLNGSFHGENHDSIVLVFDMPSLRQVGAAILHIHRP